MKDNKLKKENVNGERKKKICHKREFPLALDAREKKMHTQNEYFPFQKP